MLSQLLEIIGRRIREFPMSEFRWIVVKVSKPVLTRYWRRVIRGIETDADEMTRSIRLGISFKSVVHSGEFA